MKALIGNILHRLLDYAPPYPSKPIHRHWVYRYWERCEPELRFLKHYLPSVGSRRTAVDVGANHGYYAIALSREFRQVHAFEIIPELAAELRRTPIPNLTVWTEGLSDQPDTATLHIPIRADGYRLLGWASLQAGNYPGIDRHEKIPAILNTLDAHDFADVDFIKIDVEGHELAVLMGAIQTLQRHRPVVLVEVKSTNVEEVRRFFGQLDYMEKNIGELAGMNIPLSENRIFLPLKTR